MGQGRALVLGRPRLRLLAPRRRPLPSAVRVPHALGDDSLAFGDEQMRNLGRRRDPLLFSRGGQAGEAWLVVVAEVEVWRLWKPRFLRPGRSSLSTWAARYWSAFPSEAWGMLAMRLARPARRPP